MGHESATERFRVAVDEKAELRQDGDPNVVGTDDECAVSVVRLDHCVNESVSSWDDVSHCRGILREGSVKEF